MDDENWTEEQIRARVKWRQALNRENEILRALRLVDPSDLRDRERAHNRLDQALNAIDKRRAAARELFPGVVDSFTIATWEL